MGCSKRGFCGYLYALHSQAACLSNSNSALRALGEHARIQAWLRASLGARRGALLQQAVVLLCCSRSALLPFGLGPCRLLLFCPAPMVESTFRKALDHGSFQLGLQMVLPAEHLSMPSAAEACTGVEQILSASACALAWMKQVFVQVNYFWHCTLGSALPDGPPLRAAAWAA